PAVRIAAAPAGILATLALFARPVLSVGPTVGIAAAAIIAAVTVTVILGPSSAMAATVGDGSLAALVLRSGGVAAFAFVGMVVSLLRWIRRCRGGEVIARALAALVVFAVSGMVASACWRRGALGVVMA